MNRTRFASALALSLLLASSCATTGGGAVRVSGTGDRFAADSVLMTAGSDWGSAAKAAEFTPAVTYRGIESVEAAVRYGETTAVWNFTGLAPDAPVEVRFMLNLDLFMSDSMLEVSYLPGTVTAEDGLWPRDAIRDAMAHKWVDSLGRFAGSEWPDTTDGWKEVVYADGTADANGEFSVVMIFNHYTENPPLVMMNFTNPTAEPAGQ